MEREEQVRLHREGSTFEAEGLQNPNESAAWEKERVAFEKEKAKKDAMEMDTLEQKAGSERTCATA